MAEKSAKDSKMTHFIPVQKWGPLEPVCNLLNHNSEARKYMVAGSVIKLKLYVAAGYQQCRRSTYTDSV